MVFHGFWLVSMVCEGGFMVFHGFWLVSMVFKVVNQIQTDFCFSQSGGSSSPVTILIPVSVLNKSSLKPSFFEYLSSELGGYM